MALALIILVVLLVILGETHHSYGNFAFVRMHQGKAVLVTLMVPLIFFYAWSFGLGVNVLIGCFYLQVRLPL